jgi:hypothetical protein
MPIELPTYARSSKRFTDPYAFEKPTTSWGGIVGYILGIFLIIMVILVIINYTITPIFRLYPGGPGYIPIPGGDTSQIYWKTPKDTAPMFDGSSNVVGIPSQWSFAIDIDIKNPMHVSQSPRVLFHRSNPATVDPSGTANPAVSSIPTTLKALLGNYNVAIALLPDTTDLVVSVLNSSTGMENVILQNVPVQTPFRVGVIISDTAMEVYLNGMLQRTRTFESGTTPFNSTGMFFPPQGMNAETARVANLHLWNSAISANQMRYASPALMTVKPSEKSDIPSSSCASGIEKEADSSLSSWSSTFQTNLGSLSSSIQSSVNSASSAIQSSMKSTSPSTTSATPSLSAATPSLSAMTTP